jgi:hypothetical protein
MMCNKHHIRLVVKYTFIIKLFGDANINIIFYILNQTLKNDLLMCVICTYFGTEGVPVRMRPVASANLQFIVQCTPYF